MNLKEIRKKKEMTQEDVATAIGMSNQAIHYYENNLREPNLATLKKLSNVLGVTVDELIWEEEKEADHDEKKTKVSEDS